jgi:hypothetical protein
MTDDRVKDDRVMDVAATDNASPDPQSLKPSKKPTVGAFACVEQTLEGPHPEGAFELSLTSGFGQLFEALLPAQRRALRSLSLDYPAPDRVRGLATFSAKVVSVRSQASPGEVHVELGLVIFAGHRVGVRGRALFALTPPSATVRTSSTAGNSTPGEESVQHG